MLAEYIVATIFAIYVNQAKKIIKYFFQRFIFKKMKEVLFNKNNVSSF